MLKKLRSKKTSKKIWIILAILIVPAFVLWGSGSVTRGKQEPTYAGKIFGKRISFLEYNDALSAVRSLAIRRFGDNLSEIEKNVNLESEAWDRLMLLYEARRRKIKVSDQEIIDSIETSPDFQKSDKFDERTYETILQYYFHTRPRAFEEQTRQDLMISKLYDRVTKDISVNDQEVTREYQKINQELSIYYIVANLADFAKDISFQDNNLKDYFNKNSLDFKQPESFNLEYVATDSEDKIKNVMAGINRHKDFDKSARVAGLEVKQTGLFTQAEAIPGIGWSAQILNLVSHLKVGQFSPAIHMDKNYYILRLKDRKESYIPDFEKIKGKVKDAYVRGESQKLAQTKIGGCLKKLNEPKKTGVKAAELESAAKEFKLKFDSTAPFKFGSYIEGIGASDSLWLAAKELKDSQISGIIQMPSGFFIIMVKEAKPADEKKFETEKADFRQKLLFFKKQERFAKFTEELRTKAQ